MILCAVDHEMEVEVLAHTHTVYSKRVVTAWVDLGPDDSVMRGANTHLTKAH